MRVARRSALLLAIAVLLLAESGSWAKRSEPRIVYDGEFKGYVPVIEGVVRPDLVTHPADGRVPDSIRTALKLTRKRLKRPSWPTSASAKDEPMSRRFKRKVAIRTELRVFASDGSPLEGARVYRYVNPAFYAVNDDGRGARLFGTYRYLPYPFAESAAIAAVESHEGYWRDENLRPVSAVRMMTHRKNPFVRDHSAKHNLPIEYCGTTNSTGTIFVDSPAFALYDEEFFPRAIVPRKLRLGFIAVAEGHYATASEKPFEIGGIDDYRELMLMPAADVAISGSPLFRTAERLVDVIPLEATRPMATIEADLERVMVSLEEQLARVEPTERERVARTARATLLDRMSRRAGAASMRLRLAEMATLNLATAPRLHRIARLGLDASKVSLATGREFDENESAALARARELLDRSIALDPAFLPSHSLRFEIARAQGANSDELYRQARAVVERYPFDRWARAKMATVLLHRGRWNEANDHLRYSWSMCPGMGEDFELARALADHHWRLGLVEKAGMFGRLASGNTPEDPFVRPGGGR